MTIYGSTMYPEKGRFLDVSICNAAKDPCTLCKAGLNVGAKTLEPARRISCNLAGQILLIKKSGEMRICEIEIYSLSSLQHTATIQTALVSPSASQITQSFDDLAKFYKNQLGLFEFTLIYPEYEGVNFNTWRQSSYPTDNSDVTGFLPISTAFDSNGWGGLKTRSGINDIVGGNDGAFSFNRVPLTLADGSCGIRGPYSDENLVASQLLVQRVYLSVSSDLCGLKSQIYTLKLWSTSNLMLATLLVLNFQYPHIRFCSNQILL